MAQSLILSALYPEMEEATVGQWLVTAGATVTEGQPLAELITEKVVYEYTAPEAGTLLVILTAEKSVVPVGTVLAVLGAPGEAVANRDDLLAENKRLLAEREAALTIIHQATAVMPTSSSPAPAGGQAIRATPAARRLARERGVDLAQVTGTGPGGMITVDDIP